MPGWIRIVVLGVVLAQTCAATAQDAPMTGRGNALVATRSTEVGLEKLAIEFEFWPDAEAFRVKTQFELANHATREVHLQVGLPEPRCQSNSEEDDPCANPDAFRYEAFETTLHGAPVAARRGRIAPEHEWANAVGAIWLFDVRLRADERFAIEHRYQIAAAEGPGDAMEVTQIARAGAMWLEPIDSATLTFLLPIDSCLVVEPEQIKRRSRRVVLRGHQPWLELTYAAEQWAPTADLSLRFESCVPARDTELTGCSLLNQLAAFAYAVSPETEESSDPDPQNLIPSATAKPATTNPDTAPSAPAPAPAPNPAKPTDGTAPGLAAHTRRTPFPPPRDPDPNRAPITRAELKARLIALPEAELKRCGQAVFDAWASYYSAPELAVLADQPSAKRHYAAPLLTPEDWQWVGLVDEAWAAQKKAAQAAAPKKNTGGCDALAASGGGGAALLLLTAAAGYALRKRRTRARPPASDNRT